MRKFDEQIIQALASLSGNVMKMLNLNDMRLKQPVMTSFGRNYTIGDVLKEFIGGIDDQQMKTFGMKEVYLYGSYAKMAARMDSDIDVAFSA